MIFVVKGPTGFDVFVAAFFFDWVSADATDTASPVMHDVRLLVARAIAEVLRISGWVNDFHGYSLLRSCDADAPLIAHYFRVCWGLALLVFALYSVRFHSGDGPCEDSYGCRYNEEGNPIGFNLVLLFACKQYRPSLSSGGTPECV